MVIATTVKPFEHCVVPPPLDQVVKHPGETNSLEPIQLISLGLHDILGIRREHLLSLIT
jgi:hypothetical protein